MATSADIETALVNAVAGMLYPASGPAFAGTVIVARGWPTEADIRNAVGQGADLIGVYAMTGDARDVTKTLRYWQEISPGRGVMEVGRIEQSFRLDIWACTENARDALLDLLEPALRVQIRYTLPDGSVATLMNMSATGPNDRPSRADEWAQSFELRFQYPILYTQDQPVVTSVTVVESTTVNDGLTISTQNPLP